MILVIPLTVDRRSRLASLCYSGSQTPRLHDELYFFHVHLFILSTYLPELESCTVTSFIIMLELL